MRKVILFMVVLCLFMPTICYARYGRYGDEKVEITATKDWAWQGVVTSSGVTIALPNYSKAVFIENESSYKPLYYSLDGDAVSNGGATVLASAALGTADAVRNRWINFSTNEIRLTTSTSDSVKAQIYIIYDE